MKKHVWTFVAGLMLVIMAAMMAKPIREESATFDEPVFLAAGYSYYHGAGFIFDPEAPPLAKLISAAPFLFMDVHLSPDAQLLLSRQMGSTTADPWSGGSLPVDQLYPSGSDNWYYWPHLEVQGLGQMMLYTSGNDADKLLAAGRWMQVAMTIATGVVIFFWLLKLARPEAGALGVGFWAFNPLVLAYGHLVLTDMGMTLMTLLAVWSGSEFVNRPTPGRAVLCGLACGGALAMKFSGFILAPILFMLAAAHVRSRNGFRALLKYLPVMLIAAAGVVVTMYAPHWKPAPPLPADQAVNIGVPFWFQLFRPILVPPDFFKGLALLNAHEALGHEAYLCGQWQPTGWWYYFPVALGVKMPVPLLLLTLAGLGLSVRRWQQGSIEQISPWIAALIYLGLAMTSTINIGVRHCLPMFPLLAVGIASQFIRQGRRWRVLAWLCSGWLLIVTWRAHPYFLEYFNEFAGGPANGYKWLADSNLDWGQDLKRLKQYLAEHAITRIKLAYFGQGSTRPAGYYGFAADRVTADQAHVLRSGILVVSASLLVRPEWDWLRQNYVPTARVGYTLFVYNLGDVSAGRPNM